jgi:hypothetical protein
VDRLVSCLCFLITAAFSQVPPPAYPTGVPQPQTMPAGPQNLNFHQGVVNDLPVGWFIPKAMMAAGYGVELSMRDCRTTVCAVVTTPPQVAGQKKPPQQRDPFGTLMQTFEARAYRGKTVHLRASLRMEASSKGDKAQMWMRIDCEQEMICAFDNMNNRPVRSDQWKSAEIKLRVPESAVTIDFGVMSIGHGRAWMDEMTFESGPK